jgi:hypothetical protein
MLEELLPLGARSWAWDEFDECKYAMKRKQTYLLNVLVQDIEENRIDVTQVVQILACCV